ncbi:MAG TPA: GGDEF domain-containing protein [Candidatus Paceibacterota bacterium]
MSEGLSGAPRPPWRDKLEIVRQNIKRTQAETSLEQEREISNALRDRAEDDKRDFDSLTGLLRRDRFEAGVQAILSPSDEQNTIRQKRLSLLFVDIDNFKAVNDTFGHDKADDVLRAVADVLKKGVREDDIVARWGGEELVVALPGATERMAAEIAEELRKKIEQLRFGEAKLRVTASVGVAASDGENPRALPELMKSADDAMYFSKESGRNRVTTESGRETEVRRQGELNV